MALKNIFDDAPWPFFAEDEIEAAERVLRSGKVNYWTGDEASKFEKEFAEAAGCRYAVALANGSVALELALIALDIKEGDEVIVTPRSFIASASSVVLRGAKPVFADVDRDSGNITAESIEKKITPRTKAIIPVHLGGWPCDMDPIIDLVKKHDIKIIEDCAQSHGAFYRGRPCGSLGDAAAWSFCQDKIMTTGGEGGMLTTNDRDIYEKAWSYKDHGKSREAVFERKHPPGFRWLHESIGTNWRMTEVQAAIGRVQLKKLADRVAARRKNASILIKELSGLETIRIPVPPGGVKDSYYRLYAYIVPENLKPGWNVEKIKDTMTERGVPGVKSTCPEIYLEKAFRGLKPPERLPVARELGETALMFLTHPTLTEKHMLAMSEIAAGVLEEARK